MWREIQRIRESKEGTHFQIGTIVKWKPDHATQQLLRARFRPQYASLGLDPFQDAIQQGLYWRGVVIEDEPRRRDDVLRGDLAVLVHGRELPPAVAARRRRMERVARARFMVRVRSLRVGADRAEAARELGEELGDDGWYVSKEYLVPARRPAGHIGDQAAHAAQLRFADNPGIAPAPAPTAAVAAFVAAADRGVARARARNQNVWTARLIAHKPQFKMNPDLTRRLERGEGMHLWPAFAESLGDVPPEYIEPRDRKPAPGPVDAARFDNAREGRDARFRRPGRPRAVARAIYENNPVVTAGEAARRAAAAVGGNCAACAADAVLEEEHNAMAARDQEAAESAALWTEELPGPGAGGRRRPRKSRRRRRRKSRRSRRKR